MLMKTSSDFGGFGAGNPIVGFVVGEVIAAMDSPDGKVGDLFGARLPFRTIQNLSAEELSHTLMWKLTDYLDRSELSLGLGLLGMPGSTAYGGLVDVLRPQQGETIWVSAAAGAVGGMVGMLAKSMYNCTTIGSCGGESKCATIKEKYQFDHAVDYKACADKEALKAAVREIAPEGIDMYFENVGGAHFEAAYESLRRSGRIAVCGSISKYNEAAPERVQINSMTAVTRFLRIEGFMCDPWLRGERGSFLSTMHMLLREGKIAPQETVFHGLESFGDGMRALFTGGNIGKVVVLVE
jgi:NADPH-dependent curcumin reductase CurA